MPQVPMADGSVPGAAHAETAPGQGAGRDAGQCDGVPLTQAQAGLWYAQRLDPGNPVFNTGQYTELQGPLDVRAFTLAVNAVMAEAEGLAMRIWDHDGVPMAAIDPQLRPQLRIEDWRGRADARDQAMAQMRRDLAQPIDLAREPLACQVLYRLSDDRALWYQREHHIAVDSYGMSLIDARVAQHYRQRVCNEPDTHGALAPLRLVHEEAQAYQSSPQHARDRDFWLAAFGQAEPVASLADGAALTSHDFHRHALDMDQAVSAALRRLDADAGVSWPDILLVLCAAYVARHTGRQDAVLGVPYMGRMGSVAARVPAMVMNIMPARIAIDEQAPLDDLMRAAARALRQARRHGRYRGEQLRRDLGLLGGSRRLYGPMVNVLPFSEETHAFPGLKASTHVLCAGPVDDLTITFRADAAGNGLRLIVEANPALYSADDVRAHARRLHDFLCRALVAPRLLDVPTLTETERQHWVHAVNDTAAPVARTTLVALIEDAMGRTPDAVALEADGRALTYAELDRATRALARLLAERGVRRGDIVALALPRSVELIVALVGVMRAGAAYLPLDLQHPTGRHQIILDSARPAALLTLERLCHGLPEHPLRLALDAPDIAAALFGAAQDNVHTGHASDAPSASQTPGPDDAAYVLYTSGSTGAPKGVVIAHDAIVNRLQWMRSHYAITERDRILQKTPYTFDVSVWEFFLPLLAGATLVVAPPEAHRDPAWLARILRQQRISVLHFVPSMLAAFLDEPQAAGLSPRLVFCSGEELTASLRDRFHQALDAELHNLYGPTEAAVDVSWWPASRHDTSQPVPIGFPVWNTALYVLDAHLRPVAPGVAGRLFIGGRQLAQGYLGQPELTAQRFLADPFLGGAARMYDTGDLARWRPDGALEYMGRQDHQIKIRGQRIELGEIEAVLAAAHGVHHVAVLAREDRPGDTQVVAYVVGQDGVAPDAQALRAYAASRLPEVMVPAAFVALDALPVTANGKLDRRALPAPQAQVQQGREPAHGTEQALAQLFADVLARAEPVCADDDFFALGGHSLLAARLAAAIRTTWQLPAFSLGAVFEHTTVARLARHLDAMASQVALPAQADGSMADSGFGLTMRLRAGDDAQPALYCVHPAGGLSWCYGALARSLPVTTSVWGLQARSLHAEDGHNPWPASLDIMAADYVDRLLALPSRPPGPVHLLGWSVGGIIAHAMAVELQRRGIAVGALCLLDAYPSDCWRDQPEPGPDEIYKALLHIAGYDPLALTDVALERDAVVEFLRRSGHPLGELPSARLDGVIRTVARNNELVRHHRHQRYDGDILYFRAALDHQGRNLVAAHWRPYVRGMSVHELPFLHAHLTGAAAVAQIGPILARAMRPDAAGSPGSA